MYLFLGLLAFISFIGIGIFTVQAITTKNKTAWRKSGYATISFFILSFINIGFKPPLESPSLSSTAQEAKPNFITEDKSTGWVGTPSKMFETCQEFAKKKYGKEAKFYYEDAAAIEEYDGKYKAVGILENGKDVGDAYCISSSQSQYEIIKYNPITSSPTPNQKTKSIAEKLVGLGQNPNKDVIETTVEKDNHYYLWNRPDLGEKVQGNWNSKTDWWIKIRKPTFTRRDLSSDMTSQGSNGVAESFIINSGPLKGGYYVESETQINIYSDSPRAHELNHY